MTQEQYERWMDFALRMARTCYAAHRRPSCAWIVGSVQDFFGFLDPLDIPLILDWDNSDDYPEKHGREHHLSWCGCNGLRHAHGGEPRPDCGECRGSGLHYALFSGPLMCDYFTGMWDDEYYGIEGSVADEPSDTLDERRSMAWEQYQDQWCGPVACCVRAGIDMACAPSMGVMGFTAGDIRKMYPDGVPAWLFPPNEKLEVQTFKGVIPGVGLVPGDRYENGTFADLPDEASVWL